MGMHEIKHLLREIEDSFEHAGKHMHIALPVLLRKQSKRIAKIRHAFEEQDQAVKKFIHDAKKEIKANKKFKDGGPKALEDLVTKEGKRILKGHGDDVLKDLGKAYKHNKHELYRMYVMAAASEYGKELATGAVANGLYEHYVEGTPAGEALSREDFVKFVQDGEKLGLKGVKGGLEAQKEGIKQSDWLKK